MCEKGETPLPSLASPASPVSQLLVKLVQLVSAEALKCREASDGVSRLQIRATHLSVTHSLQRMTCNIEFDPTQDKQHQKKELKRLQHKNQQKISRLCKSVQECASGLKECETCT